MLKKPAKKYKLLREKLVDRNGFRFYARRIKALCDIPEHGVKTGDLGGYIRGFNSSRKAFNSVLSHQGTCWIGDDAVVTQQVRVEESALIDKSAVVFSVTSEAKGNGGLIAGTTHVTDNSSVMISPSSELVGASVISGTSQLHIIGSGEQKKIFKNITLSDRAKIISLYFGIANSHFSGSVIINNTASELENITLNKNHYHNVNQKDCLDLMRNPPVMESVSQPKTHKGISSTKDLDEYANRLQSVENEFDSYRFDIVKLIKYPLMADLGNPFILELNYALKQSKRVLTDGDIKALPKSIEHLEKSFLLAESKARTTKDTFLTDKDHSKLQRAIKLLSIAYDSASSENEKEISCRRIIEEVKGIIPLEKKTIQNLKQSVGLRELTS